MKVLKMQIKQIKELTMIVTKWRGYTTTIKKEPFYCKIELFNSEDNHFYYLILLKSTMAYLQ